MTTREQGLNMVRWIVEPVALLMLAGIGITLLLRGGDYASLWSGLVALAGFAVFWGSQRMRYRNRLRTVLNAFAEKELARRR